MECITRSKSGAEVLMDYCSGKLDGAQSGEIARHVAGCSDCRKLVEAQRELWRSLDQYPAPEVSSDFDAKLYARIAREESAPAWRRWMLRIFEPPVPVAMWKPVVSLAATCAVLAVGLMLRTAPMNEPVPQILRTDHGVDIETIATALDDLDLLTPRSAM